MDSFWNHLPHPTVGLAAMDGVTDASMRHISAKYGKPDFMITEFTSSDGVIRGVMRLLRDLSFTEDQRPIVAQLFGSDPESFHTATIICCALGFDGIDINMGCPANSVAHKGGGAALINTPDLAVKIIRAVQQGVKEWSEGRILESLDLPPEFVAHLHERARLLPDVIREQRTLLPVSVKTRIGFSHPVVDEWIGRLLETNLAVIAVHGRTLEQHYGGEASWEHIAKAASLAKGSGTLLFGNGDLKTPEDIVKRVQESGVDGVWIGRAAMGNPWIFEQYRSFITNGTYTEPTIQERFSVAIEHAEFFEHLNQTMFKNDPLPFLNMRKHLGWYVKNFPDATAIRAKLYQTNTSAQVKTILSSLLA